MVTSCHYPDCTGRTVAVLSDVATSASSLLLGALADIKLLHI